jgi:hypothetical protein
LRPLKLLVAMINTTATCLAVSDGLMSFMACI